jgi:Zn-finger nucleic acid-binding protein
MSLDDTFTNLASFLNSLDAEGEQKFELSHSLVIICPDCGKNIAFRGRCPKCGGNSWIPAGHTGGIFERTRAQRWRRMMSDDDDTASRHALADPEHEILSERELRENDSPSDERQALTADPDDERQQPS